MLSIRVSLRVRLMLRVREGDGGRAHCPCLAGTHWSDNYNGFVILLMGQHKYDKSLFGITIVRPVPPPVRLRIQGQAGLITFQLVQRLSASVPFLPPSKPREV